MASGVRRIPITPAARLQAISTELDALFFERNEAIWVTLCTILAGEHTFWLGEPGTAKSNLLEEITSRFVGAQSATFLMDPQMDKGELFGPIDIAKYDREGVWQRDVEGYLPSLHTVLLDEVFKTNPGVLNMLLRAVNERKFRNGRTEIDMPLLSMVGASNELGEVGTSAIWDRFLTRLEVTYIQDPGNFADFLRSPERPAVPPATIKLAELRKAMDEVLDVELPEEVITSMVKLRSALRAESIRPSDRRWKQCRKLLKAAAYLAGRDAVNLDDLMILQHALWSSLEERTTVAEQVAMVAGELSRRLMEIGKDLVEKEAAIAEHLDKDRATRANYGTSADFELRKWARELKELRNSHATGSRQATQLDALYDRVVAARTKVYVDLLRMPRAPKLDD